MAVPVEPDLDAIFADDPENGASSVSEYLAMWGCDHAGDKPPARVGDGFLFYGYGEANADSAYLEKLKGALERLMSNPRVRDHTPSSDLLALEAIHGYVEARIEYARQVGSLPKTPPESETIDLDGNSIPYAAISEAVAALAGGYIVRARGDDYARLAAAVNQGIDARLQACFVPDRGDSLKGDEFRFSPASLPVLVRRLLDTDDAEGASESMGRDILGTLGFGST